jgi:predicted GIY-YIG superfamily endonuclease
MSSFWYVYVLVCAGDANRDYTGMTQNLNARLKEHNRGACAATAPLRPWKIETSIAFRSEKKARAIEDYLKKGSGREFARRHF